MLNGMRIGFVGSGKMAEAMIAGLLRLRLVLPAQIAASGPRAERGAELSERYPGICTTTDNKEAAKADILVLSLKPQTMAKVLTELSGHVGAGTIVISIAAGVAMENVSRELGSSRTVRAMPNTPGRIGKGITVWTCAKTLAEEDRARVASLLGALGEELFCEEEKYLDMATALSGTGPAYVYLFMESLVNAGVGIGLPRHLAERMVLQTVVGSAAYARESKAHLAQLRDDVSSPAGTTCAAMYVLETARVRAAFLKAVRAAYHRSIELGKS